MKVLHFYKTSMPDSYGGVESFIDTLCRADAGLGIENTVLTLSNKPTKTPITMDGYTVHQVKQNLFLASTGFSLAAFNKFKKLAQQADIVHYHFPNPFADILHFACRTKKPSIITYHSDIIKQKHLLKPYQPLMHRFLSSADHIIATSPNYLASSQTLQKYTDKVSIIPIGIDVNSYDKVDEERLQYWCQHLNQPFFLFIGAMRYYKGLHIALDALVGTNIKLVIAGSNGMEKTLKNQAKSLGLAHNVDFLGFISDQDKTALLKLCYGLILPSHLRSEAFGIALLEAAACAKPMISCEIGTGTSFVNINDETGLVINPASPRDLQAAMQYLLNNPTAASEMGKQAKKRVADIFAVDKQAQSYHHIYTQMLSNASV